MQPMPMTHIHGSHRTNVRSVTGSAAGSVGTTAAAAPEDAGFEQQRKPRVKPRSLRAKRRNGSDSERAEDVYQQGVHRKRPRFIQRYHRHEIAQHRAYKGRRLRRQDN